MYCLSKKYLSLFSVVTLVSFLLVLNSYLPAQAGFFLLNSNVQAATTTLQAVINPGTLTLASPTVATISAITLEGTSQTSTGSLGAITINDNRGTGSGWSVTLTVSDFTCCTPARTIGATNLTINPGLVTTLSGKVSGVTSGSSRSLTSSSDAATLMNAVTNSGMGSYRVSPTLSLAVPGEAFAGTYTATVTITVI